SGVPEGACGDSIGGVLARRDFMNERRGVSAELQVHSLFSRDRVQLPPRAITSSEREDAEAIVADEHLGNRDLAGNDLERVFRYAKWHVDFARDIRAPKP